MDGSIFLYAVGIVFSFLPGSFAVSNGFLEGLCDEQGGECLQICNPTCRSGCDADGACYGGCTAGWTGIKCDTPCSDYHYGVNCQKSCGHCENDAVCDPVTGQCPGTCVPGFTGPLCNQPCDPYYYGKDCKSRCHHCRNNKACNIVTGYCVNGCAAGWTGERCDTVCTNRTFGIDCTGKCGHCANNDTCNHVTGECKNGCAPGWTGLRCHLPCSSSWYGEECDFHCGYCISGTCDSVTGQCTLGCSAGWKGPLCKTPCEENRYGEDCKNDCGHCDGGVCDRMTGICPRGCLPGWRGVTCHQECKKFHYGKSCALTCGQCLDGQPCNITTGACENGCKTGWQGRFCTQRKYDDKNTLAAGSGKAKKQSTVSLLVVVIVLLFIALSSTIVYFVCIRPKRLDLTSRLHRLSSVRSNHDAEPHVYEQVQGGPWEITKANLILTNEKLGHGQFGQVRKGFVKNVRSHNIPVAVKSLKVSASEKDKTDFMNELMILKKVGHHVNIVCLVGSCNIGGTLYVAMEYCIHGDLRTHLRNSRKTKQKLYTNVPNQPITYSSLLRFALNVASGMAHLANRQIIHRDLAARNVLLDENYVAKVADFGLSKNDDTYVKTSRTKVPVRWLALESIFNNTYTTQSDVWSFGVLLWETVTYGGTPYHGMDTQQFCNLLKQGYRLCRPRHCDLALYAMMVQCWQEDPDIRPDFTSLESRLQCMVDDTQCWQEDPDIRPDFTSLESRLQCMVDDTQIYINIDEELGYTNMDGHGSQE